MYIKCMHNFYWFCIFCSLDLLFYILLFNMEKSIEDSKSWINVDVYLFFSIINPSIGGGL